MLKTGFGDEDLRPNGKVVLLTGPNACGKSIYLKQIGLLVFLSHLGCWIPAESASIPLFDSIFTRIRTLESLELGMSAFMVDVNQMAVATNSATSSSLVLIDEFGKGTSEIDGQALLASCLEYWLKPGECKLKEPPFVIAATHFTRIKSVLPTDKIVHQTFAFESHGEETIYLYKLQLGSSVSSLAKNVARKAGIETETLKRSDQILAAIQEGSPIPLSTDTLDENIEDVCDEFLNLDFQNDPDVLETFLSKFVEDN